MLQNWKDTNLILQQIYVNPAAGINAGAPQANVHIGAGIAAINGAPLMIDPGVILTTPANGAIESDGTHIYWTDSTNTRRTLDQQASSPSVPFSLIGTNSSAFAVAQTAGPTNPAFQVDTSAGSQATGIKVTGKAAASGVAIAVISSGTNENLNIDAKGSGTIILAGTSTGGITLTTAVTLSSTLAAAATTISSNSANALAVGANGTTNPVLKINASTGSVATGLAVTGAAAAAGVAVQVISSGTNENLTIDAKATGTVGINTLATTSGLVTIGNGTSLAGVAINGPLLITSASATASQVGPNGSTNPVWLIDASTGSQAAGIKLVGATAAGTVAFQVISSGANASLTVDAKGNGTLGLNTVSTTSGLVTIGNGTSLAGVAINGTNTTTSANASALTVGLNGATNPALQVDASTGSSATGLKIKSAAAAAGIAISVISSGTNENLTIDAKGSGTITINGTGTGQVAIGQTATAKTLQLTSTSAGSFVVGRSGSTNPAFRVDSSAALQATGLNVAGNAAASGVAVTAISSGTNENLTIDAKGSGTLTLGSLSTGAVIVGPGAATVLAGTLTAGGLLTCALQVATSGPLLYSGSGVPTISAAVKGSVYMRTDGASTSTRLYVATDTAGTWTGVTTAA